MEATDAAKLAAVEAVLQPFGLVKKFKSMNKDNKAAVVELFGKVSNFQDYLSLIIRHRLTRQHCIKHELRP